MYFRINKITHALRKEPSLTANADPTALDPVDDRLVKIDETTDDSGTSWFKVEVLRSGAEPRQGFVEKNMLEPFPENELAWPEIIDRVSFLSLLTTAARRYEINRDILAIFAQAQSGIANKTTPGPVGAIGPFQFTRAVWNDLVATDEKLDTPFGASPDEIQAPGSQGMMAALFTRQNLDHWIESYGEVPTGAELFAANLFRSTLNLPFEKAKPLLAALKKDDSRTMDEVVKGAVGENDAEHLLQTLDDLVTDAGTPRTFAKVLEELAKVMRHAIDAVNPDIARLPRDLHVPSLSAVPDGEPPWLAAARQELARGVKEDTTSGGSNPRIEEYFATTTFGRASDDESWCGAFISFCLEEAGGLAQESNLRSARAADWKDWAEAITDPPIGALCVLRPLARGASGHVGWFIKRTGGNIELLGGNQGNAVSIKPFSASDVVSYRWLNWTTTGVTSGDTLDIDNLLSTGNRTGVLGFLDFIAQFESRGNYNARFGKADNKHDPQFTAMSVDGVLSWQKGREFSAVGKYQIIRNTLSGLEKKLGLTGGEKFDEKLQDKLGISLLKGRGIESFLAGKKTRTDFALSVAQEWAALPRIKPPNPEKSYYAGVGPNKALVPVDKYLDAIDTLKKTA